ncbi:MAG: phage terminase large subunit [Planctomycetota bacterium]
MTKRARLAALVGQLPRVRRRSASASPRKFAQVYLPHHFRIPGSRMHEQLFNDLLELSDAEGGSRLAVAAPRSHAKTTVVSLAFVLWSLLYERERFVLLVSATREQAQKLLADIRSELTTNDRLLDDFPELCHAEGTPPRKRPWKQGFIALANGSAVRAVGVGQGIRGLKHGSSRPTLVIGDDLEELEPAQTEEGRDKVQRWFEQTLLKIGTPRLNVVVVGTILHRDSLLARLVGTGDREDIDPWSTANREAARRLGAAWTGRLYRAVEKFSERPDLWERWQNIRFGYEDYDGETGLKACRAFLEANRDAMLAGTEVLWPEHESFEQLMVMRADEGEQSFMAEKQNSPIDPTSCVFAGADLRFWDDPAATGEDAFTDVSELLAHLGSRAKFYGACDPSLGHLRRGDYSAVVTLVRDQETKVMYVIGADIARIKPEQLIKNIVSLALSHRFSEFCVEANHFQEMLADELSKQVRKKRTLMNVTKVQNRTNKEARISALQPLVAQGLVRFSRRHRKLLEQLTAFPNGKHDDGPDALEMVVNAARDAGERVRVDYL